MSEDHDVRRGLLERLDHGAVICDEGYLFELERRGYLQAGGYVPEVVLDHPEKVRELHREFVHAGSDVVEAFTYYAHREKLRVVGKEGLLERINRQALALAREVALESGTLCAGNVCNTNIYVGEQSDPEVRAMFEEQVGWAVEAEVDFVIGETFDYADESDRGPYPIPRGVPIEGGPRATGDRHVIVVEEARCRDYELYDAHPVNGGRSWHAG